MDTYTLDDLRQELSGWQELALCNEDSAYAEATARENLLAFMQGFQTAIEALYTTRLKKRNYQSPAHAALNSPRLLTLHEQAHPMPVIRQFAETFSHAYTQAELLDLLEAVVSYHGKKKIQLESVVFVYQRLCFLACLIYELTTGEGVVHAS